MKLFIEDAYMRKAKARVVAVEDNGAIVLDRTIFYAQGGGQPGDTGSITTMSGEVLTVQNTQYSADRQVIWHITENAGEKLAPGDEVNIAIDWARRYARMRAHTALHLLTAVLPYPVTGGAISDDEGRLDFDMPEAGLDRQEITDKLNALIATDAQVRTRWISDEELLANPGLIKTMSVKPPMGTGKVRLVEIVGLDLQPCGGTHVATTAEIGRAEITNIEKKDKQNRRIRIRLTQIG